MIFVDSNVLLKCLGFTLRENVSENLNRGRLWFAVPPHMTMHRLEISFQWNRECSRDTSLINNSDRLRAFLRQCMVCAWYILKMHLIKIHDKGVWNIIFFKKWYNVMQIQKLGFFFCSFGYLEPSCCFHTFNKSHSTKKAFCLGWWV